MENNLKKEIGDNFRNLHNQYGTLFEQQLELEESYKKLAENLLTKEYNDRIADGAASKINIAQKLIDYQFDTCKENIKTWFFYTLKPKPGVKPGYLPLLQVLQETYKVIDENDQGDLDELLNLLTFTTFSVLINNLLKSEFYLNNLAQAVCTDILDEARLKAYFNSNPQKRNMVIKGIAIRVQKHFKTYFAKRCMEHAGFNWHEFSKKEIVSFGAKLVELTIDSSDYFETVNTTTRKGKELTEIHPTQWFLETWSKNQEKTIANAIRYCPTVIPPAPWESFKEGGYYGLAAEDTTLLRIADVKYNNPNVFSKKYLEKINQVGIGEVREAINAIQATSWKINEKMLDVLEAIVNLGGDFAGIPRIEPLPHLPYLQGEFTQEEFKAHKIKQMQIHKSEARRKSKALRVISHLKTAKQFVKYERIYFPHNMDFRGRVYPISPFSPQGDDINKSLLLFADVPPCESEKDIEWLMIHGANLAGIDKVSFEERKQWIKDNEHHILASAKDPLGCRWWADLDSPCQFLAFCFEWERWVMHKYTGGTAKGFVTGIPIAFDGTCSGLQHFSAILRDEVGAKAVNLIPSEKPQDIYSIVAEKVNEKLKYDATNGTLDEEKEIEPEEDEEDDEEEEKKSYLKLGTKTLAQQWLMYEVTRKVVKRSCMTLAYGSKEYGFREQILEDTIRPAKDSGLGEMFIKPVQAASYLAKLIWNAVKVTVVAAVDGMKWLQQMAQQVCKKGQTVTWTTPMGLPIQQAYMECKSEVVWVRFGGSLKRRRLYIYNDTGNIDKKKQSQGIAPNFIHSMDAAHLQLTVLMSMKEGIRHFAMIHDSYGTTVAQADLIFKTVRQAFVKMYSENDVLLNFKQDMKIYLDEKTKVPDIPKKGNLDLELIKNSKYAFA